MNRLLLLFLPSLMLVSCHEIRGKRTFATLDDNGDRVVTEAEFASHISENAFLTLDRNKNGRISRQEWHARETGQTADRMFETFDSNNDDAIEATEFEAKPGSAKRREIDALFRTLDKNHDGGLEWNEIIHH